MLNTFEAIEQRRSVKHYDAQHQLTDEEKEKLFSLIRMTPTAFNQQNYRFVVVEDETVRDKLKEAAHGQEQVTDASLLIVICADLKAWEKSPVRYWENAPGEVQDYIVGAIDNYYRGKEQVQRDEAMRSAGMAAQTIMLAAKTMGYDSCPMDGFDFDKVGELINLPEDHAVAMFVVVGKAEVPARPRPTQIANEEVFVTDRFV